MSSLLKIMNQEKEIKKYESLEQSIVKIVIAELIDRGFIKKDINTFERTKEILRKYKRIKNSTKGIDKQIKNLENSLESVSGLKPNMKKGTLLVAALGVNPTDYDGIYSRINELKSSKVKINVFLDYVKLLVEENANEADRKLFDRIYFEASSSVKDICDEKGCDSSTIYRRINNVVNKIYIELFPDSYLDELCYK